MWARVVFGNELLTKHIGASWLGPGFHFLLNSKVICNVLQGICVAEFKTRDKMRNEWAHVEVFGIVVGHSLWLLFSSTEKTKTQCETHRDSLLGSTEFGPRGPRPAVGQYIPSCDENGSYEPMQCHGSTGYCWCVERNGQEVLGTRSGPGSRPMCE